MANQIIVNAKAEKSTISRMIYGHFAEHLGRCIYDGFYVGEDSKIPNVNGMRTDIIEALKRIKIPCLRWPGGMLCGRIPLARRHRAAGVKAFHGQHPLGRRGGEQPLRHP